MNLVYKLFVFTCLLTGAFGVVQAQKATLTVRVVDEATEQAIDLASVFINPCSCGGVTNDKGTLEIELGLGAYQVVTSFLGYANDTAFISLDEDLTFRVDLQSTGYQLEDVVISGKDNRANVERVEMGVQQISSVQLQQLPTAIGEVDVLRGLTMLPGVGSAGEASNGLSVRGGSLDQNLVLLDNAPIFNPTHLFGLFSVFTPEAVSEVSLLRANMPAKYGGRIASVVDIKVKNPTADRIQLGGGVGFVSSRLAIEAPLIKNKLHILASGRVAHNDWAFQFVERLKKTKANFWDGTLKLKWQLSDQDIVNLTGFFSHDFYQLDINSNINNVAAESNQYEYATRNGTLSWIRTLKDQSSLQTTLVSSDYLPKILFPQSDSDNTITYESRIQYRSLLIEWVKKAGDALTFTLGGQGNQYILSPGGLLPGSADDLETIILPEEKSYEWSGFADVEWNPTPDLALSAGLRFTYYSLVGPFNQALYSDQRREEPNDIRMFGTGDPVQNYDGLEPRLGMRVKLSDASALKASYSYTRQYLQNIYNSTTPLPTSRWKTSDPYVRPQSGHTFSLGLYQNLKEDQLTVSLEGYYRLIKDVLDYKAGADFFLQEFIEQDVVQGEGKTYGLEFNLEKPYGSWNGWLNYTWSRSLRRFEAPDVRDRINNNEWFSSDFDRPHVVNSTINLEMNDFNTFSFNFTYSTGRPYTVANAIFEVNGIDVPIFLERNNARLPDYHRLDFSWRVHNITTNKAKRWKGDWIFTIYNLYGRKNPYNWYYGDRDAQFASIFKGSPLGAYQLAIFSAPVLSLGYSFTFE